MDSDNPLAGRYRLVECLGAGGMSVVWSGYDEVLRRRVAIKVLNARLADYQAFRRRLRVEARAAARLNHPHITDVYDYGESVTPTGEPVPFVVMELVDGHTLASRLAGGQAMPLADAALACAQVGAALAAAHRRGIVHRDVTPGNVMLTPAGAKILDFGISALVGEAADTDGHLLGTPAYLAPERLSGLPASTATDVYGLGLTFYRAVAGRLPFDAGTKTELLRAHLYTAPTPLPEVAGLPSRLADVCLRSLAKQPEERPSITELTQALADSAGVPMPAEAAESSVSAPADLPAEATTATILLPWWNGTHAVPQPVDNTKANPRRPNDKRPNRRVRALAGAATVALGLAWIWVGNPWAPDAETAHATSTETPGLGRRLTGCTTEYRLRNDNGRSFTADLTVSNTGTEPLRDWALTFDAPGDPRLRGGTGASWTQHGRTLTAQANADTSISAGASAKLSFSADYTGVNALPVTFRIGNQTCTPLLTGVATVPATTTPNRPTTAGGHDAGTTATTKNPSDKAGKDQSADMPAKKTRSKGKGKNKGNG